MHPDVGTPAPLSISTGRDGDRVLVIVTGEIDMTTADTFCTAMIETLIDGVRWLIVDMAAVVFMDSSGIAALVHARAQAQDAGATLTLINCRPRLQKVMEVTGVYEALTQPPPPSDQAANPAS